MNIRLARATIADPGTLPAAAGPTEIDSPQDSAGRSLGPDLVRAFAALLVVYLHACVPYLQHAMPGLVWAVEDGSSTLVSSLFWSIEVFIMPLFLVIAGYFAHRSWNNGGGAKLIASRARRLLLPLLAATVILLPLDYYIWVVGWVIEGQIPADRLWKLRVRGSAGQHLYGLGHLWFLHYVFLYCVVLAVAGWVKFRSTPRTASTLRTASTPGTSPIPGTAWAVAIVSLPLIGWAVLALAPEVVFGFQHAFLPVPTKWLYSGTFFFGGVAVAIFDPQWRVINRITPRLLGGGVVCGWAAVTLGQWAIERSDPASLAFTIGPLNRILLAAVTVAAAWGIALGVVGGCNRVAPALATRRRFVPIVSYLAAAGLWIYLVHHPLVALIHVDLKLIFPDQAPLAKSLVTTVVSLGLSLLSYEAVIRVHRVARRNSSVLPMQEAVEPRTNQPAACEAHQGVRRAA